MIVRVSLFSLQKRSNSEGLGILQINSHGKTKRRRLTPQLPRSQAPLAQRKHARRRTKKGKHASRRATRATFAGRSWKTLGSQGIFVESKSLRVNHTSINLWSKHNWGLSYGSTFLSLPKQPTGSANLPKSKEGWHVWGEKVSFASL